MKSQVIGAFEAKTRLSELLDRVDKGQVYVITKRGRPVAELRPAPRRARLQFGTDAGRITIREDFDDRIPDFADYTE
ncbi:MAG: type II toxin-antitoxin system Phd/YefM family antitoxin [Vicinamibacterales bacterium]